MRFRISRSIANPESGFLNLNPDFPIEPTLKFSNHNVPCLTPKVLRNHCFQFLLGITVVLREIEDYGYAKF